MSALFGERFGLGLGGPVLRTCGGHAGRSAPRPGNLSLHLAQLEKIAEGRQFVLARELRQSRGQVADIGHGVPLARLPFQVRAHDRPSLSNEWFCGPVGRGKRGPLPTDAGSVTTRATRLAGICIWIPLVRAGTAISFDAVA